MVYIDDLHTEIKDIKAMTQMLGFVTLASHILLGQSRTGPLLAFRFSFSLNISPRGEGGGGIEERDYQGHDSEVRNRPMFELCGVGFWGHSQYIFHLHKAGLTTGIIS